MTYQASSLSFKRHFTIDNLKTVQSEVSYHLDDNRNDLNSLWRQFMLVINITVATRTPLRTCFNCNSKSFSIFFKSLHSDLLKLIAHDEYAIVYQCSVPSNASNIGDLTFNIHFDHTELHSQQSYNLNLTSIGRYNITGEDEIFDENFEIEVHHNSILLSRFRV